MCGGVRGGGMSSQVAVNHGIITTVSAPVKKWRDSSTVCTAHVSIRVFCIQFILIKDCVE